MSTDNRNPILLKEDDVRRALPMSDAIQAMKTGFEALSTGRADVPMRPLIGLDEFSGMALFMPAYDPALSRFGIKVVSNHTGNRARGLAATQGVVLLFSAEDGRLEAILEGRSVTAIRTGAGSGLATDLLARDDAHVVTVFGAGVQARSHLEAVCAVRNIDRAFVIGRSEEGARAFALEMSEQLDVHVEVDDGSHLKEADVICTTTTASEPILHMTDIKAGVHINAVGTHRPTDTEIDEALVRSSKLVVDQRLACLEEAGEIVRAIKAGLIDENHIFAELGEIVAGGKAGRQSSDEITLFKSVGNAIQDLAAAKTAVENARRLGIGQTLNL